MTYATGPDGGIWWAPPRHDQLTNVQVEGYKMRLWLNGREVIREEQDERARRYLLEQLAKDGE